jgi:catechol 2,3-dioxygenase-like lactoylglutathione lyase family enzyme
MAVSGIGFVGLRTEKFAETLALFRDVIGVPLTRRADGLAGFSLDDGTVLEVYERDETFHAFFTTGPVVGLKVERFYTTRAAMIAAAVEFIGEIQSANGVSWQHFRLPDGTVAEIIGRSGQREIG